MYLILLEYQIKKEIIIYKLKKRKKKCFNMQMKLFNL